MSKIILGFVGDLAAGKGTIAKYLQEKYGCNAYRFSTMLRDILDRIYVGQSRDNMQKLSTFLRENFGQDVMSRVIAEDVARDTNDIVVVEGVRRPSDIAYLEKSPGFHLIYITGESKIRWERMKLRQENSDDANKTFEAFLQDEQAEADRLIKELGQKAEFTIVNNDKREGFYDRMDKILTIIRNENKN